MMSAPRRSFLCLFWWLATLSAGFDDSRPEAEPLQMSPAVACRSIDGFENYEPLPDASLTSDEKLLVYYRPLNYQVDHSGKTYKVHLVQDARLRRRGQKAVLQAKDKILDYEAKTPNPPGPVFLRNTVSMKGLMPGEYDFEIILHDALGKSPPASQVLKFKIVPAKTEEKKMREESSTDDADWKRG